MIPATGNLSPRVFKAIATDSKKCAEAADLRYVSVSEPGISRAMKGKGLVYSYDQKKVKDPGELSRIKNLVIPPAWQNVWICKDALGHIQCTGFDLKGRKQYKYHPLWNHLRSQTKFFRMTEFGDSLPQLRMKLEKDLSQKELTEEKVLATAIKLMESTYIRVGNASYEKFNGSHGLTTLKDRHIKIKGDRIAFAFKGKKGIQHDISIKNKRLARIVKQCRDIPGKELFQYRDAEGNFRTIDSGTVNTYIKNATGKEFTAKDFRTWAGTLCALQAFKKLGFAESKTEVKRKIVKALDVVSSRLGNTRMVCKKYYVHPAIIGLYENQRLQSFLDKEGKDKRRKETQGLTVEENIVMRILKSA